MVVGLGTSLGRPLYNYEAAFVLEAACWNVFEDWQVRNDVRSYFERLLGAGVQSAV